MDPEKKDGEPRSKHLRLSSKIRVGPNFQAEIPELQVKTGADCYESGKEYETPMWIPPNNCTEEEVDLYVNASSTLKLLTEDQALNLLYQHNGNTAAAFKDNENIGNSFENKKKE